ncbi:MAG: FUSC family protein, partial [Ktedonobacteraceae bacterium]|nr:FUSC family protein [Ktedonobacteraceae bacterium]
LTLWAWPIRPYQPIRDAVAGYYQALRALLACTYSSHKRYDTGGLQWEETLWQQRINVQTVRDTAHQMVSQSRDPQSGASLTAQQMFLLMLKADTLFATLTALSESIKAAPLQVHQATVQEALDRVVDVVDDGLARVAAAVQHSEMVGEHIDLESVLEELDDSQAALHKMPLERETDYVAFANARHIFRTLRQIILSLQSIISIVDEVDFEPRSGPAMQPPGTRDQRSVPGNAWHKFVDNLTPHSQVYRHALRLSVTVALATAISTFFKIPHGYWMPLTAAFILRPDFQATRQRVWQRVGGTIAGGACAIVLVALIYNQMILYFLIAVLCFLTYAHFSRHYGVFSLFLTPFLVLFIDVAHPGNWEVALERVANTVAGGVLALIAIYLFWPQWESERLPEQIARALAANRCFFHCVLAGYLGEQSSPAEIEKARQQANLECVNAASSLQRLANEPRARQVRFEQFYALVMYTQRLCSTITALSAQPVPSIALRALPGLSSLARQVEDTLQRVEDAVSSGKQPLRMPQLEEGLRTVQNALSTWIAARIGELAAQDIKTPNRELLRAYAPLRIHLHDLVQDAQSLYQAISTS